MLHENYALNQEYFKPKNVVHAKPRSWGAEEKALLLEGLNRFGVGAWNKIGETLLPDWSSTELRVKTGRVLGRQSVVRYKGWKPNAAMVAAEFEANRRIGTATGMWKGSLVADEGGEVEKLIAEHEAQHPYVDAPFTGVPTEERKKAEAEAEAAKAAEA